MSKTKKLLCYFVGESLPADPGDGSLASLIRDRLIRALQAGVTPATLPSTAERRALDVPLEIASRLEAMGPQNNHLSPGRIAGGLLLALHKQADPALAVAGVLPSPIVSGLRVPQVSAIEATAPHLLNGRLALVEAGTGSGKSRIIAHLAAYVLALRDAGHEFKTVELQAAELLAKPWAPGSPAAKAVAAIAARRAAADAEPAARAVLLAAPTVANVMHLVSEYEQVADMVDPGRRWHIGVVFGRRQFVSMTAVRDILAAQAEPDAAVAAWADAGFPTGSSPTSKLLARMYPGICGLADDLRSIATDFPIEDALLSDSSAEGEDEWYRVLREVAQYCDIVAVTHAMLATDNNSIRQDRVTILPKALALFLDEAHAFESAQADSSSSAASMFHLRLTLRSADWGSMRLGAAAAKALGALDAAYTSLQAIKAPIKLPAERIEEASLRRAWDSARLTLAALHVELKSLLTTVQKKDLEGRLGRKVSEIRSASVAIGLVLKGGHGSVGFSPMRRYPHLLVGPSTVDPLLAARWEHTPCGALLSGTLLYPSITGPQAGPTIRRMALPPERTVAPVVLHPHWIRSTPLLFTPVASDACRLVPPSAEEATPEAMRAWLHTVARVIADRVCPTAAGGTLVLMTGYERLRVLQDELAGVAGGELRPRLIAQDRHLLPLTQALTEFERRSMLDEKPILLGLGGAWTGIDLRDPRFIDSEAYKDNLLTDLVIPALPFGMNRTTTHEARLAWAGFSAEKDHALRLFLQGLGRLIRRDGLRNRRIWVLDGRLLVPARRAVVAEFKRVLEEYPMRREFDVP